MPKGIRVWGVCWGLVAARLPCCWVPSSGVLCSKGLSRAMFEFGVLMQLCLVTSVLELRECPLRLLHCFVPDSLAWWLSSFRDSFVHGLGVV